MSFTSAHVPIKTTDKSTGAIRDLTSDEFDAFKTNKLKYSKWLYSNRKAVHKQLVSSGVQDTEAWKKAFEMYPKPEEKQRFIIFKND